MNPPPPPPLKKDVVCKTQMPVMAKKSTMAIYNYSIKVTRSLTRVSLTVNVVIFAWGLLSRFCLIFAKNNRHAKIKPIYIYEGNRSSIVKITPT